MSLTVSDFVNEALDPLASNHTSLSAEYLAQDETQKLVNVTAALAILETTFFILFIIARVVNRTSNGIDFWLMPAAYIGCFGHAIANFRTLTFRCYSAINDIAFETNVYSPVAVKYGGAGRPFLTITSSELVSWMKLTVAQEFLYMLSVMLPKLAVLGLYLRIFFQRRYRYVVHGVAIVVIANWIAGCLLSLLICRPFRYNWDKSIPGGQCGDVTAAYRWASLPNVITDVAILVLPIPAVWNLKISLRQKIGVTLTFAAGSL